MKSKKKSPLQRLAELNEELNHSGEEHHPDLAEKWNEALAQVTAEADKLREAVRAEIAELGGPERDPKNAPAGKLAAVTRAKRQ